jgi:hypothetical protein
MRLGTGEALDREREKWLFPDGINGKSVGRMTREKCLASQRKRKKYLGDPASKGDP